MSRRSYVLLSIAAIAAGGLAAWPSAQPMPGHNRLHVNCPPGSHVARNSLTFGPELQRARAAAIAARSRTSKQP